MLLLLVRRRRFHYTFAFYCEGLKSIEGARGAYEFLDCGNFDSENFTPRCAVYVYVITIIPVNFLGIFVHSRLLQLPITINGNAESNNNPAWTASPVFIVLMQIMASGL